MDRIVPINLSFLLKMRNSRYYSICETEYLIRLRTATLNEGRICHTSFKPSIYSAL